MAKPSSTVPTVIEQRLRRIARENGMKTARVHTGWWVIIDRTTGEVLTPTLRGIAALEGSLLVLVAERKLAAARRRTADGGRRRAVAGAGVVT